MSNGWLSLAVLAILDSEFTGPKQDLSARVGPAQLFV